MPVFPVSIWIRIGGLAGIYGEAGARNQFLITSISVSCPTFLHRLPAGLHKVVKDCDKP